MKKFIFTSFILILSCCLVGCKKSKDLKDPLTDNIKTIVVCEKFYEETFYINDLVELSNYTVLVTYESGTTETLKLSSFGVSVLDTSSVGTKNLNFIYKEKSFIVTYEVLDIVPINAMYKGDALEIYRDENCDFLNVYISVLFNNGEERNISLAEFTIPSINQELSSETKTFTATFKEVSVNIPYTVTNRPIEENVDYDFDDTLNIFSETSIKIRFVGDKYIVHSGIDVPEEKPNQTATKCDFNRYWTLNVKDNKLYKIAFYLVDATIYCEILEEIK